MGYTPKDYSALLDRLRSLSDEKYRVFNESLIPGSGATLGVRIPMLRKIAREISRNDPDGFLCTAKDDTLEEKMLAGFVIAYAKFGFEKRLELIAGFVPKIDNWAICDTFCSSFRFSDGELPALCGFIGPYLFSPREYDVRFAAVMLMDCFINDGYIDKTLTALASIKNDGYYAKMAAAWAMSVCFVKYRDKTLQTLLSLKDPFTKKKAIQKIRESYRVSREDKEMLKAYQKD